MQHRHRKTLQFLTTQALVVTTLLVITSCTDKAQLPTTPVSQTRPPTQDDPASPVKKLNEAFAMCQYDEMRKCLIKGQGKYIEILEKAKDQRQFPEYVFREEQRIVSGTVAKIWHNTPPGGGYITIAVKEDGAWKVDFVLSVLENNK